MKIVGSDDDAGRKKSTAMNHGIEFKDAKQMNRYKTLVSRHISAWRYPDSNTIITLGIRDTMVRLLNTLACTIWSRKEVGMMRTNELFMLWAMLYDHLVNICYYLIDYLVSIAKKKLNDKGDIVVGEIITFIARKFRVNMSKGINRIEGNYYLDLDTLTTMSFLRIHGLSHN